MEIRRAETESDWAIARELFEEYAGSLDYDLCFQSFSTELETLATMYGPPAGSLLLAEVDGAVCGCVAVRRLKVEGVDGVCEMKRLYLKPAFRGGGRGLALANAILAEGRRLGYCKIRLDTLPTMQTAAAMYRKIGFREIAAYYASPVEGTLYMELDLESG